MTELMPRPRPPHLHKQQTRHGAVVWYVRLGHGPRTRIYAKLGTPEFTAAYEAALLGQERPQISQAPANTLAWLIKNYLVSADFRDLAPATRRKREIMLRQAQENGGDAPYAKITPRTIQAALDRRADRPFAALDFLKAMRGLWKWAVKVEHVRVDPCEKIVFKKPKSAGHHVWTDAEVMRFEKRWPLGTREHLAMSILLYTGLRRGDAVRLGPEHVSEHVVKDDAGHEHVEKIITIVTEKTDTEVVIPVLPDLQRVLDASPLGEVTFIATVGGKPMEKTSFGNFFADAAKAAKCPGRAHGLRKAGATRAANNGATERQLNAIFGWADGSGESATYTKQADRRRLARDAIGKLSSKKV